MNHNTAVGHRSHDGFWTPENNTTNINDLLPLPEDWRMVNLPDCIAHIEAEKREWWAQYLNQKDERSRYEFLTGQLMDNSPPSPWAFFGVGMALGVVVVILLLLFWMVTQR